MSVTHTIGRLTIDWSIHQVTDGPRKRWAAVADGLPRVELQWGTRRRSIATLWIGPTHHNDQRLARVAFETGPLPEHGIAWRVTWHTWDSSGTGGENADEADLATAIEVALFRCLVQGFIPTLETREAARALSAADSMSADWRKSKGLGTLRWSYA